MAKKLKMFVDQYVTNSSEFDSAVLDNEEQVSKILDSGTSIEDVEDFKMNKTSSVEEAPSLYDSIVSTSSILDQSWVNIANYPSKISKVAGDRVILDCLVDKSNRIYEKRIFSKRVFGNNVTPGNLYLIRIFERKGEFKVKIEDNKFVSAADFDFDDYVSKLEKLSIFNTK